MAESFAHRGTRLKAGSAPLETPCRRHRVVLTFVVSFNPTRAWVTARPRRIQAPLFFLELVSCLVFQRPPCIHHWRSCGPFLKPFGLLFLKSELQAKSHLSPRCGFWTRDRNRTPLELEFQWQLVCSIRDECQFISGVDGPRREISNAKNQKKKKKRRNSPLQSYPLNADKILQIPLNCASLFCIVEVEFWSFVGIVLGSKKRLICFGRVPCSQSCGWLCHHSLSDRTKDWESSTRSDWSSRYPHSDGLMPV